MKKIKSKPLTSLFINEGSACGEDGEGYEIDFDDEFGDQSWLSISIISWSKNYGAWEINQPKKKNRHLEEVCFKMTYQDLVLLRYTIDKILAKHEVIGK